MADAPQRGSPLARAAWIAIAYAVVAGLWISFSDLVLSSWFDDPRVISRFQTLKGWGFVAVTSLVLLGGAVRHMRDSTRQLGRIEDQRGELRVLSQFQRSVIDNASVWMNVLDTSAQVTVWNKAAEQISGYTREEVLGNPQIWEWLYPDPGYRAHINTAVMEILDRGREVEGFESRILTKSGEEKIIAWNSRRFFDEQGRIVGSIAIGQDITARKQAEQQLVERERQLATLMANLPGMAYRCLNDDDWTMKFVSDGCRRLIGYAPEELINNRKFTYASVVHEDDQGYLAREVRHAVADNQRFTVEYRVCRKNGEVVWVWEQGQAVYVDGQQYLEGIVMDINRRKAMEQELEKLATRDALTGLYNRREFEQQFREELARAQRYQRPLSLLWIDVDHFKRVNDRYGHRVGDEVLTQLGALLASGIRSVDYAARYGGEELIIVLPELDESHALETAERLRQVVDSCRMLVGEDEQVGVTISVGVAMYPTHGNTLESLLESADKAMYRAKQKGRNQVCLAEVSAPGDTGSFHRHERLS